MPRICIVPRVEGAGGMASFRLKLEEGLRARRIEITYNLEEPCEAILIIGGTKNLLPLWKARQRGTRIVQRLDGINWIHRRRHTGLRHFVRAEYGNLLLSLIRSRMATHIVYQSRFARRWWEEWYGVPRQPCFVVHNGVDLEAYSPAPGNPVPPGPPHRLLVVEGRLGGGYDVGLDHAVALAGALQEKYPIELVVAGEMAKASREKIEAQARVPIRWMGSLPRSRIAELDRSAHLLFSADLYPACPNSVIEALACGLPVAAFDTGALSELVVGDAGRLVPYGGDPWRLDPPDIPALARAAAEILEDQPRFRRAARAHAESALGLEQMVDDYLKILLEAG